MHRAWGAYPETVLTFPELDLLVDLRNPLSPALRERLRNAGLGGPFGVVTACNPLGTPLDPSANRRLTVLLATRIASSHPAARRADGGSPDGTHQEAGWAIPGSLEQVRQLAATFLQNAVFWFDGTQFTIVPVHAPGEVLPLPLPLPPPGEKPRESPLA